jgi:RNA polymerase primary sigma factor
MKTPSWPKAPLRESEKVTPVSQESLDLVDIDKTESLENAVLTLKKLIEDAPRTGRSLSSQAREFVIPLESQDQKNRLLDVLSDLDIFPWEESGEIIIDRRTDLKKLETMGFIFKPKEVDRVIVSQAESTGFNDKASSFPVAGNRPLSEVIASEFTPLLDPTKKANAGIQRPTSNDETPGIDADLQEIVLNWKQGLVDEDDPTFMQQAGVLPSLRLFPRQFEFKNKQFYEKRTGKEISSEEFATLLEEGKSGDVNAITKLVRLHVGLVIDRLIRLRKAGVTSGIEADDVFQEGMVGLTKAIKSHDAGLGVPFSSYAIIKIESVIRRYAYRNKHLISRPEHTAIPTSSLSRAKSKLTQDGVLDPKKVFQDVPNLTKVTTSEGKKGTVASGVGLDRLERLLLLNATFNPLSEEIDTFGDENEKVKDQNLIQEEVSTVAVEQLDRKRLVEEALEAMDKRDAEIIRRRFGIGYDVEMSLEEVGELYGVSRERVRQIESRALRALKHPSRSRALRALLNES